MTETPLLALWRSEPATALYQRPQLVDDLKAFLLQHTTPNTDDERRLVDAALHDQAGYSLLELARTAANPISDYAMSLVLAAALMHLELAALVLSQELVARARRLEQGSSQRYPAGSSRKNDRAFGLATRRLLRLASSWAEKIPTSFFMDLDFWRRELGQLGQSAVTAPVSEGTDSNISGPGGKGVAATEPSLTVTQTIGDSGSADGEAIARLYHGLTEPLALKGHDIDPDAVAAALSLEFPHFANVIASVVQDIRLRRLAGAVSIYIRPLLLLGPAGIGKTRFARRLAQLLGLAYGEISGAGSSDDRTLRGTARGFRGHQPALPLLIILRSGTANPIIVVDEIDKAGGSSSNGDIRRTLTTLLERDTAAAWFDECLLAPCDLSHVSWILTANELTGLSGSLLNRLRVVRCLRPTPEMFDNIFESVLRDIAHGLGIEQASLPTLDGVIIEKVRQAFARHRDVRHLKRLTETVLGTSARRPRETH